MAGPHDPMARASLGSLIGLDLLSEHERAVVERLGADASPVGREVALAETVHLHIKVDDTAKLPADRFVAAGDTLDQGKEGFVKYRFSGAVKAMFSHIRVSQDELAETLSTRRPRPFLDHRQLQPRRGRDRAHEAGSSGLTAVSAP